MTGVPVSAALCQVCELWGIDAFVLDLKKKLWLRMASQDCSYFEQHPAHEAHLLLAQVL